MGKEQDPVVIGYDFYVGLHFVICHGPFDDISKVFVDEEAVYISDTGDVNSGVIHVVDEKEELDGDVEINAGFTDQQQSSYLISQLGGSISAYRGVFSAVARQIKIGRVPYLKPWKFRVKRIAIRAYDGRPQWYAEKAQIGTMDMNGVHIIRECLTDVSWGMGHGESLIDETSFRAAADIVYSEDLRLSFIWSRQSSILQFINEVLSHIDAVLYVDRTTGNFVIKLLRDDYDIATLPLINEDTALNVTEFTRQTLGDLENAVTVKYWDSSIGNDASLTVQDLALVTQQGGVIATTRQYKGAPDGEVATKLAARDLRVAATPLIVCVVECDRHVAGSFNVGDPFLLAWDNYDLEETVMRVTSLRLGTETNNAIKIECTQDIFREGEVVYAIPPATGWTDPITQPTYCPYRALETAPYYRIARVMGDSDAQALDPTDAFLMCAGSKPSQDAFNISLYTSWDNIAYAFKKQIPFAPAGIINGSLTKSAMSVVLTGDNLSLLTVGSWIQIGSGVTSEAVEILSISDNTYGIGRGCLDTVPQKHANRTRVWGFDRFSGSDWETHSESETLYVKMLPKTAKGTLGLDDAPADSITFSNRQYLPYPPGKLQFNGAYWPADITGDMVITWAHRDRLQQTAGLIGFTEGSIGPEAGTTYNLTVYNDTTSSSIHSEAGITGVTKTITKTWAEDDQITITLESQRDGEVSFQKHTHILNAPVTVGLIEANGRYWNVDGDATLLAGGTNAGEPHLYEQQYSGNGITISDSTDFLGAELTKISNAGGNFFRCTLANWKPPYATGAMVSTTPFAGSGPNFDLTTINTAYFDRLDALLYRCEELGIVVQLELFDPWWLLQSETAWEGDGTKSPHYIDNYWNPARNTTYTTSSASAGGLPDTFQSDNDKFTAPMIANESTAPLVIAQKLWVDNVCTIAAKHGNALIQIENESPEPVGWDNAWADYINAKSLGLIITTMRDNQDITTSDAKTALTDSRYNFADSSQSTRNITSLDDLFDDILDFKTAGTKPINAVKIYRYNPKNDGITIDKMFVSFMAGNAGVAFHPGDGTNTYSGLGVTDPALKAMTAARWLDNNCAIESQNHVPLTDTRWNNSRPSQGAWACVSANYLVIYVSSGSEFQFDNEALGGYVTERWINVETGALSGSGSKTTGEFYNIRNPWGNAQAIVIMTKV